MPRKPKRLVTLIIRRIWNREKTLFLLFVLSIVVIILKEWGSSSAFLSLFHNLIMSIASVQNVLFSFAISLLSGIIVYYLTIIVPEVRKSRSLFVEIEQTFLYLESCFIDLALEMQIGDLCKPEICANKAVESVKQWCVRLSESDDYCLGRYKKNFLLLAKSFNRLTEYLLGYSYVLSEKEIDMIVNIRQRDVSKRIMCLDGVENSLSIQEIHDYFREIAQLYIDICKLHNKVENKIYKKKQKQK